MADSAAYRARLAHLRTSCSPLVGGPAGSFVGDGAGGQVYPPGTWPTRAGSCLRSRLARPGGERAGGQKLVQPVQQPDVAVRCQGLLNGLPVDAEPALEL